MAKSLLGFSEDLYSKIVCSQKGSLHNTCLSPYSIYTALCSTLVGCVGPTKEELAKCLHLSGVSSLESTANALKKMISCEDGVEINSANKIFIDCATQVHSDFMSELKHIFDSEPKLVNFTKDYEAARDEINHWASDATHQRITELFPRGTIDKDTRVVLGNAVFFKGAWKVPFSPSATFDSQFHVLGGGTCPVKMMRRQGQIHIEEFIVNDAMALKLPFKDPRFELLMMLPKSNDEFPAFVEAITKPGELEKVLEAPFYDQMAQVMIPRFKLSMTPSLSLKETLKSMGVIHLFDQADLKKLSNDPLFVSDVVHQAVLEVNEAGAVATGATGVGIANRSLLRPIEFKADHAFVVAVIVDKIPLFIGHVTVAEE